MQFPVPPCETMRIRPGLFSLPVGIVQSEFAAREERDL